MTDLRPGLKRGLEPVPEVVVSFLDGELIYGELPLLHMDDPFLEIQLQSLGGNLKESLVPVSAVRQIDATGTPPPPSDQPLNQMPKVALHFLDGQVMRAMVVTPASLQRFGAVWDVVEAGTGQRRIFAIPYTALKAAYYVRHWDTRRPDARNGTPTEVEQRRLAELHDRRSKAGANVPRPRGTGLMDRLSPGPDDGTERQPGSEPPPPADSFRAQP
jgi:hypothetical protein